MITRVNQRVQHVVIKTNHPFSVEFMCMITGRTVVEHYAVPLTKMEIQAEYDYIIFPVTRVMDEETYNRIEMCKHFNLDEGS